MKTVDDHLRKHPRALPSTLAFIEKRNTVLRQMKDEISARKGAAAQSRKSILDRVASWLGRR